MRKIPTFQLRIFVVSSLCLLALPRAKDDSMGRMPLRAPKVLQLSRNPRTWKSLGVILLRLHVFTVHICFFLKHVFSCLHNLHMSYICLTYVLHMSSGVLLCLLCFCWKIHPKWETQQFEVMISFFILVPCAFQCPARWNRLLDFPQHGWFSTNRWENSAFYWITFSFTCIPLY
jgi:hypothetical protein